MNNDLVQIKKGIETLNNNLKQILEAINADKIASSIKEIRESIDTIKKKEEEILGEIQQTIEKQIEERNKLNRLIVKFFIPVASVLTLLLFVFTYWLWDKSRESILYPLSILGIGAVSIIGLVVALAIINRKED
jgi:cation transport ATPase